MQQQSPPKKTSMKRYLASVSAYRVAQLERVFSLETFSSTVDSVDAVQLQLPLFEPKKPPRYRGR